MLEPAQIFDVSSQFANKRAQQRAEEELHGYVCFVSLMNSSFAPPSCTQHESSKPSGRMGKIWCSGVTTELPYSYFQTFPMISSS